MSKIYNKLVRDFIPNIIESNGEKPKTRILDFAEFKSELEKKLKEECKEVLESKDSKERIEELADVYEILKALAEHENSSIEEVIKVAGEKAKKRGAFSERIFLEEVNEK